MTTVEAETAAPVTEVTEAQVLAALSQVQDPDLHKDLVTLKMIKNVKICEGSVSFQVELTTPACPLKAKIEADCREAVGSIPGVTNLKIEMTSRVIARRPLGGKLIPNVKHVIAVASGKGGVGKSTVATNLAVALAQTGAKVGIMDADVYGPTIPMLLGVEDEQMEQTAVRLPDGNVVPRIAPVESHGVTCVSMGFLIEPGQPVVWRGPMLSKVVNQFLGEVAWGELDYLLVDLPPGTGDVTMSLSEAIPLTGAVIVMTPQDVASSIAVKSLRAFQKMNVPILGIIENMSYFIAPDTGKSYHIFGHGGGQEAAEELKVPFLGEIPLDIPTRKGGDEGQPVLISQPDSLQATVFREVAGRLAQQISIQARQFRPLPVM
ncbi:MAG: Mrp/NBP35 family ATP-binding protein [Cytophagales bacterium]|nr:Mrp/NBP35 family ATP-binding protein [Armatimonadota bacterium]